MVTLKGILTLRDMRTLLFNNFIHNYMNMWVQTTASLTGYMQLVCFTKICDEISKKTIGFRKICQETIAQNVVTENQYHFFKRIPSNKKGTKK